MTDTRKKRLLLHIGHSKTGSSYLQEMLAANTAELARQGVVYPLKTADFRGPFPKSASGNAQGMLKRTSDMSPWFEAPEVEAADCLLYSSEYLFPEMIANPDFMDNLDAFRTRGFTSIHVLLIVRDPVEFAVSTYQQKTKMRKCAQSIEEFLEEINLWPRLLDLVRRLQSEPEVHLEIFNYSRHRSGVYDRIFDWIGVDQDKLKTPEGRVNEGLGFAELWFQNTLNRLFDGELSMFRGGAMLPRLGLADRAKGVPDAAVQTRFLARIGPQLEALNQLFPPAEAYNTKPVTGDYVFGERQLSEEELVRIVQVMGEEIRALRRRGPPRSNQPPAERQLVKGHQK